MFLPLAKFQMSYRWDESLHPRDSAGRFSTSGAGSLPMATVARPQSRSLTRGESWQRIGAKIAELPTAYTGSKDREAPADWFKAPPRIEWQAPKALSAEQHTTLVGKLKGVIQSNRQGAIAKAKETRQLVAVHGIKDRFTLKRKTGDLILPPDTPPGAVNRAYNHAAMLALHDFGALDYDFQMSDAQKEELTPLIPFMRYTRRRLWNEMRTGDLKGASQPYRAEFGRPFADQRRDKRTGAVRLRLRPNDVLVKRFDESKHTRDEKGRWSAGKIGAAVGGALLASRYARDATSAVTGRHTLGLVRLPNAFETNARTNAAFAWRSGDLHGRASGMMGGSSHKQSFLAGGSSALGDFGNLARLDRMAEERAGVEKTPTKLWRGLNGAGAKRWLAAAPGDEIDIGPASSWTTDSSIASHFTQKNYLRKPNEGQGIKFSRDAARLGEQLTNLGGGPNVRPDERKVRVMLRGVTDKTNLIDIERMSTIAGQQQEIALGAGSRIRVDRVRSTKGGDRVVFASLVGQNAKSAVRRGALLRLLSPSFHGGRVVRALPVAAAAALAAWAFRPSRLQAPSDKGANLSKAFDESKHRRDERGKFSTSGARAAGGILGIGAAFGAALPVATGVVRQAKIGLPRGGLTGWFAADAVENVMRSAGKASIGGTIGTMVALPLAVGAGIAARKWVRSGDTNRQKEANTAGKKAWTAGAVLGTAAALAIAPKRAHRQIMRDTAQWASLALRVAAVKKTPSLRRAFVREVTGVRPHLDYAARQTFGKVPLEDIVFPRVTIDGAKGSVTEIRSIAGKGRFTTHVARLARFLGLRKVAPSDCIDDRVATQVLEADRILASVAPKAGAGGCGMDPHVASVMADVDRLLGPAPVRETPELRLKRNAMVADPSIRLADVLGKAKDFDETDHPRGKGGRWVTTVGALLPLAVLGAVRGGRGIRTFTNRMVSDNSQKMFDRGTRRLSLSVIAKHPQHILAHVKDLIRNPTAVGKKPTGKEVRRQFFRDSLARRERAILTDKQGRVVWNQTGEDSVDVPERLFYRDGGKNMHNHPIDKVPSYGDRKGAKISPQLTHLVYSHGLVESNGKVRHRVTRFDHHEPTINHDEAKEYLRMSTDERLKSPLWGGMSEGTWERARLAGSNYRTKAVEKLAPSLPLADVLRRAA